MSRRWILIFIILLAFVIGIYFHTNTLEVTHHQVKLSVGNSKIKIAHVTDLHTHGIGRLEVQLFKTLEEERPDIIVITGDLTTPGGTLDGYKDVLDKLQAPKGVYFVQGNWEHWNPTSAILNTKISDLTNQIHQFDKNLWLVGFDDSEAGKPQLDILNSIPQNVLKIGLLHSPEFFKKTAGKVDLNLAGHTHGGQIRVPFFGPLWLPKGSAHYDQGWFEENSTRMYVSRGIGTSILPIRFNCSPELAIFEVSY
jgi:predicted MPP superfamily phosphohydrolase